MSYPVEWRDVLSMVLGEIDTFEERIDDLTSFSTGTQMQR